MHQSIVNIVKEHLFLLKDIEHAYLFGSVLDANKKPNDIDVLIIYTDYTDKTRKQLQEFAKALESDGGLPVDLTVLSIEEEKEVQFLKRIKFLCLR